MTPYPLPASDDPSRAPGESRFPPGRFTRYDRESGVLSVLTFDGGALTLTTESVRDREAGPDDLILLDGHRITPEQARLVEQGLRGLRYGLEASQRAERERQGTE